MRRGLILAALLGVLAASTAVAFGGSQTPTHVVLVGDTADAPPGSHLWFGYLKTSRECRANRKVQLLYSYPHHGYRVVDTDRSSRAGNWAASFPVDRVTDAKIVVPENNVGSHRHPDICRKGHTSLG
jgi:hypothetical protein